MLYLLAERTNALSQAQERDRLVAALANLRENATYQTAQIASGSSVNFASSDASLRRQTLGLRIETGWHVFNFSSLYALDDPGRVVMGAEYGSSAGEAAFRQWEPFVSQLVGQVRLRAQTADMAQAVASPGFEQMYGDAKLFHTGFSLAIASVVPVRDRGVGSDAPALIVSIRTLPQSTLREIGERYGLSGLSFTQNMPADGWAWTAIDANAGSGPGYLSWVAERPGSRLLPHLLALAMLSTLAIASVLLMLVRRLRSLSVELEREEAETRRLASDDHLTGLQNRMSFRARAVQEAARCERSHGGFAIHLIDLDRFKEVNDTLGHAAGDAVLVEVGRRLQDTVRGADIVARLGGDEFGIIQVETTTTAEAGSLASRIRDAMRRPIRIGGAEVQIGCSIGICMAPQADKDLDGLLALADSALYEAKNDGRNRYRFFESSIDRSLKMKQLVEEELREAIAKDQLELHYQPKVSADGQRIVGVEALVRWRHPVRGLIPPLDFIPLAEERGLIVPLSDWVLRRACQDGLRWSGLRVAVNVSAAQFKQAHFVEKLMATVQSIGFDPTRLELELTEGMIVEDEIKAEAAIFELRGHGVRMALDDFGTGYSSLIYLRRFSFDKIKIDRSFLESMESTGESAILVHSVVRLGRALGLTVCAEGVESDEQRRFLQAVGCHELQGYAFSRPVPAHEIDRLLTLPEPFRKAA
jgi:diguanylate cyclase (GGDEF)-like protein